ncbi:hypothetical protein Hanom_Chr05g00403851 [Helianthus anomalus]
MCNWTAHLGNGGYGGTACYVEIIQSVSDDEDGSSSSEDGLEALSWEVVDADVEELLAEAESLKNQKSMLVKMSNRTVTVAFSQQVLNLSRSIGYLFGNNL